MIKKINFFISLLFIFYSPTNIKASSGESFFDIEIAPVRSVVVHSSEGSSFKRDFGKLLERISLRHEIKITPFTREWVFALEKEGEKHLIFYYDFDINPTGAYRCCKDKSTTANLLSFAGIPHVDHKLFVTPSDSRYAPSHGVLPEIIEYARFHNFNVVCKPSNGSSGVNVDRATNLLQLESLYIKHINGKYDFCIAPYYDIEDEYRVIMIKNEPQLIYRKVRPEVIGDDILTIRQLFLNFISSLEINDFINLFQNFDASSIEWSKVLSQGERYPLKWKHNLEGGSAADLRLSDNLQEDLAEIAKKAMQALNIKFASVDIIKAAGEFKVLEVNAGVMMKHFMKQKGELGTKLAEAIYERTICEMFGLQQSEEASVMYKESLEQLKK